MQTWKSTETFVSSNLQTPPSTSTRAHSTGQRTSDTLQTEQAALLNQQQDTSS